MNRYGLQWSIASMPPRAFIAYSKKRLLKFHKNYITLNSYTTKVCAYLSRKNYLLLPLNPLIDKEMR